MDTQSTLDYIVKKFNLDINQEMPIMIPNTDRFSLARLFMRLRFKEGAEIGVQAGEYSKVLCDTIPGLKLHCVDAWEKYPGYVDFVKHSTYITHEKKAREVLAPYGCDIIKKYSMDAVKDFPDRSLDFVYIDANHDIRHVIDDITEWSNKIKKGGIISGHDYFMPSRRHPKVHVVYALQAYTKAWKISPWFVLGREEIIPGEAREEFRSWFFVI
jgi:hypothetical protein